MSDHDQPREVIELVTKFAEAAWNEPNVFHRTMTPNKGGVTKTIKYIDLGDHLSAVNHICSRVNDPKMLVRQEYQEILHLLETETIYKRGAYVIGQPGIGKTYFLIYVLLARLRDHKPVAFQMTSDSYVFFSDKLEVTFHTSKDKLPFIMVPGIVALSDSSATALLPLPCFFTSSSQIIQATSPKASRWKGWSKERGAGRCLMNMWNEGEVEDLADLLKMNAARMTELGNKWGYVPRTLLDFMERSDLLIEEEINYAINRAVATSSSFLPALHSLDAEESGPSMVFHIAPNKRINTDDYRSFLPVVKVATRTILERLGPALRWKGREVQIAFMKAMQAWPGTRTGVGNIFENWFHSILVSGIAVPIEWHGESGLPAAIQTPTTMAASTEDELNTIALPFYWLPPTPNFAGIDGAIIAGKEIFAFQITLSGKHRSPQPGLDLLRDYLTGERKFNFRMVFIGMQDDIVAAASKVWETELTTGTPTKRVHVPVGWCAVDPAAGGVEYKFIKDYSGTDEGQQ